MVYTIKKESKTHKLFSAMKSGQKRKSVLVLRISAQKQVAFAKQGLQFMQTAARQVMVFRLLNTKLANQLAS